MTAALTQLGLVPAGTTLRCNVGVTRGDTMWLDVFLPDGFLHVKVSELVKLDIEAHTYDEAWRLFGSYMPRPLGYAVYEGWDVFVTQGVPHGSFRPTAFLASNRRGVAGEVCDLFELARRGHADRRVRVDDAGALGELAQHFTGTRYAPVLAAWQLPDRRRELAELPVAPQHGDFVANNLATRRGRLLVFDWEDFAKVWWAGFDLCTLVMTSLEPHVLAEIGEQARPEQALVRYAPIVAPACASSGLTPSQFWRLAPLYLLRFLALKGTYGNEVRQRIVSRLDVLMAPAP